MIYSFKMKPIWKILAILSLATNVRCQKFQQEQYPFPPHFQTPNTPIFSSDSTIYLPPESSTPMPYFAANNMNKYPVKFLPPTAVKAPSIYPTPFPSVSSSARPDFEEEMKNFREISKIRPALHNTPQVDKTLNNTNSISQQAERRDMKAIHRMPSFQEKMDNMKHFENVEQKKPQFPAMQTQNTLNQNPASRRMIVTSEIQRNENALDQMKAASYANAQYIQAPGVIIASTEPAIPILRLSNEMDLDGSFSYEALGADQTHYVQHSRMENMGTDKEEQVVEGSYSYVGDNGQTYTVHYVADANGYRASGDHLPVAPPIPEIIQRAVQYNLAEEARRPPNLKQSWETESKDYDNDETSNRYTIIRNLFTGRTPEAFSLGFQGANSQNNLLASASSNVPVKTSYEVTGDQNKPKSNAPIAPQVTFLATQGAQNPSSQTQQTASRIVSTERPTMPQIVNYEANLNEADPEANKGLWRWQYGLNTNDNSNPSKNTISRSSGEKDDVIINFNDMTPEQYTRMLHAEISGQQAAADSSVFLDNTNINIYNPVNTNYPESEVVVIKANSNDQNVAQKDFLKNEDASTTTSTETPASSTTIANSNEYVETYQTKNADELEQTNIYSKIISSQNFVPKSSIVTQTYNIEDVTNDIYVDIARKNPSTEKNLKEEERVVKSETKYPYFGGSWMTNNYQDASSTNTPISSSSEITIKMLKVESNKNDFKPVTVFDKYYETTINPNSAESVSNEESLKDNIFLRNLLKPKVSEYKNENKIYNAPPKATQIYDSYQVEPKEEKAPKILQYQPSPQNEIKFTQKKPFDINDVFNYATLKNTFESSKMRPKNMGAVNLSQNYNHKEIRPVRYMPNIEAKENEDTEEDPNDSYQVRNNKQKELHGVIKNYKVLQRQRNNNHASNHYPELSHRNIKTFHNLGLPPLGRAGPSLKSYLPPTFV